MKTQMQHVPADGQEEARAQLLREKVGRLRTRLRKVKPPGASVQIVGILHGVLDLLADEL